MLFFWIGHFLRVIPVCRHFEALCRLLVVCVFWQLLLLRVVLKHYAVHRHFEALCLLTSCLFCRRFEALNGRQAEVQRKHDVAQKLAGIIEQPRIESLFDFSRLSVCSGRLWQP